MKKMNDYEVIRNSMMLYIIVHLLAIIISAVLPLAILIMLNVTGRSGIYIVSFITVYLIIIIITRPLSKSKVSIQLRGEFLKFSYFTFLFKKRKEAIFYWDDINDYLIQEDVHFIKFYLSAKSEKQIKFNIDTNENVGIFKNFIRQFESKVGKHNSLNFNRTIDKKKSIYESQLGFYLAVLIGCIMLSIPIVLFNKNIVPKIGYLITFYFGGIYYLFQIYQHRNKS